MFRLAFNHQVVNVCLHVFANLAFEGFVDEPLIGSSCIFEAKRHLLITKDPFVRVKGCFFLILFLHEDLVIAFVCIKKAFKRVTCEGIDLEINFR
ncbi:hypothetical protein HanIR_Chr02g0060281 [Helianthus annuus]|nr:hypothetical protein HanIR_Chr02g0060281 [Helianthus annuus]